MHFREISCDDNMNSFCKILHPSIISF